jgi:hypothetical protein
MPIFHNTLNDLIKLTMTVPMKKDNFWHGVLTGGSTASFVDSSRWEADDFFQNLTPMPIVRICTTTDGLAPQGEERTITDWTQSSGTGVPHLNFTIAPAAGDTYAIMSEYSWAEVTGAINSAIDAAARSLLYFTTDETVTFISDVYEYPIPTGILYIFEISQGSDEGKFTTPLNFDTWRIIHKDIPLVQFDATADGMPMRIEGLKRQERLVSATDVCYIDPNYVAWQAAAYMHASRVRRANNDPDAHQVQYTICQAQADRFKTQAKIQLPLGSKRCFE